MLTRVIIGSNRFSTCVIVPGGLVVQDSRQHLTTVGVSVEGVVCLQTRQGGYILGLGLSFMAKIKGAS